VPSEQRPQRDGGIITTGADRYWRTNLRIVTALLVVWAVAGLGCGVLFADALSAFHLGGFPLGFWFAQQGSIVVFVVLILVYAVSLNRLDRLHRSRLAGSGGARPGPDRDADEHERPRASDRPDPPP